MSRETTIDLEGELWKLSYQPSTNWFVLEGENHSFTFHPGVLATDIDNDVQRVLDRYNNSLEGRIKAELYYAYVDTAFEGDSVPMELMDTLIIRLVLGQPLAGHYDVINNTLSSPTGTSVRLPTTGSELGDFDFQAALVAVNGF